MDAGADSGPGKGERATRSRQPNRPGENSWSEPLKVSGTDVNTPSATPPSSHHHTATPSQPSIITHIRTTKETGHSWDTIITVVSTSVGAPWDASSLYSSLFAAC